VNGIRYDHDVIVEAGRVRPRDKRPSRPLKARFGHTPLSAAEDLPASASLLVVGTGDSARLPILPEVVAAAEGRGAEVRAMPTSQACALLRTLEASQADAVLHVTC